MEGKEMRAVKDSLKVLCARPHGDVLSVCSWDKAPNCLPTGYCAPDEVRKDVKPVDSAAAPNCPRFPAAFLHPLLLLA
jgi:hypothetical protein